MIDHQLKAFLEVIYQAQEVRFKAEKSQEEISDVVGDLIEGLESGDAE
ncbi:MAG: hypothetical protein AAGU32_15625 [Bacillota bacterium]